jgi:hypothetical protein
VAYVEPTLSETYQAIHARLRKVRGPAKFLTCENCGRVAEQWAYDRQDPDERTGENSGGYRVAYSINLDHYRPLCAPCHKAETPAPDYVAMWVDTAVAPPVEFEFGTVEPPRPASRIDLRKPDERTGARRRCSFCFMVKDAGAFRWRSGERRYRCSRCRHCDRIYQTERNGGRPRGSLPGKAGSPERWQYHRTRAIAVYGGRCVWCGVTEDLEFDHPDNDGAAHRRVQSTASMINWISAHGRPLDNWRLQLLCKPCHRSAGWRKRRAAGRPA